MIVVRKVWLNDKRRARHAGKLVTMSGLFLFGVIPFYLREDGTIEGMTQKEQVEAAAKQVLANQAAANQAAAEQAAKVAAQKKRDAEIEADKLAKKEARKKKKPIPGPGSVTGPE